MIKITKAQNDALEVVKKMIAVEGAPKDWADDVFKLIYGILDIEVCTPDIVEITDIIGDGTIPVVPQGPVKIGRVELTEPSTVPAGNHPFPIITTPYIGDQIPPQEPINSNESRIAIYDGEVKSGDWVCGATTVAGEPVSVIGSTTTSADFIPDGGFVQPTTSLCDPITYKIEH
jgi:hypothetical protein